MLSALSSIPAELFGNFDRVNAGGMPFREPRLAARLQVPLHLVLAAELTPLPCRIVLCCLQLG